jgi:hypothetical protein
VDCPLLYVLLQFSPQLKKLHTNLGNEMATVHS